MMATVVNIQACPTKHVLNIHKGAAYNFVLWLSWHLPWNHLLSLVHVYETKFCVFVEYDKFEIT